MVSNVFGGLPVTEDQHICRSCGEASLQPILSLGCTPLANGLLLAYGVPAIAFAAAAILFRRRADDALVATLETGAAAFATVLVALEIRHAFGLGHLTSSGFDFPEAASHVLSLAVLANVTMRIAIRQNRPALGAVWRVQGGLAVLGAIGLLVLNPFMTGSDVGQTPVANWLLAGYLAPAGMALLALPGIAAARGRRMLSGLALMLLFAWVTLEVRHWFHPDRMGGFLNWSPNPVSDAELWAYSWAWLGLGGALMGVGVWRGVRGMRLAALSIVGLATAKIFLVDMADLVGLWRVLSFLGLGLMLIGLGAVYRRFVAVRGEAGEG